MLVAAAIAAGIMPKRNGCRRAVNKQRYGCAPTKTCVSLPYRMVTIFSNSSAELISGLDWDQIGTLRLVFGLSHGLSHKVKSASVCEMQGNREKQDRDIRISCNVIVLIITVSHADWTTAILLLTSATD